MSATFQWRCLLVMAAVGAAGCGGSDERNLPMTTVTGTVKYKTALPEGQVVFQHVTGEPAAAKFGPDGKYQVDVPQGKNQVLVQSVESSQAGKPTEEGPRAMEVYTSRIPERYSNFETSGLTVEVGTSSPQTYDISLDEK